MTEEHTAVSARQQGGEYTRRSLRDITPHERNRIIGLAIIEIGLSAIAWFYISRALNFGVLDFSDASSWLFLLFAMIMFWLSVAWKALVSLLVHPSWFALTLHCVASLTLFIWFGLTVWSALAYLIAFAGFAAFHGAMLSEAGNRLRFSAVRIIGFGRGYAIVGSLLAISVLLYSVAATAQQESNDPTAAFNTSLANAVNQSLQLRFKSYHPEETVDEFLQRMIIEGIRSPKSSKESLEELAPADFLNPLTQVEDLSALSREEFLAELPDDVRNSITQNPEQLQQMLHDGVNTAVDAQFNAVRNQLLSALQIDAKGSTQLGGVVQTLISQKIGSQLGGYVSLVPPILALVVFLVLNFFSLLYRLILDALVGLLFFLFTSARIVTIKRHEVTAEYPSL